MEISQEIKSSKPRACPWGWHGMTDRPPHMGKLVTHLRYHRAVAALQRQNEPHLFAMCLAINIYVVIQGSKK